MMKTSGLEWILVTPSRFSLMASRSTNPGGVGGVAVECRIVDEEWAMVTLHCPFTTSDAEDGIDVDGVNKKDSHDDANKTKDMVLKHNFIDDIVECSVSAN
jgi:hypothetical protein